MPALGEIDQVNLLRRVLECSSRSSGWPQVLDFIDNKLSCRSFLAEYDRNSLPLPQLGGLQSAIEIGSVLRQIETEGGRNALQFLLSDASLFYPYCKTTLAGGKSSRDPARHPSTASPAVGPEAEDANPVLQASPGLISPVWRTEATTILFACLFVTHTPATIDTSVASDTFGKIVQALAPGLTIHFRLQGELAQNQINQAFLSALGGPAVLIDARRRILALTSTEAEALADLDATLSNRDTLIFRHKQIEACLADLQAAYQCDGDITPSPGVRADEGPADDKVRSVFLAAPDGFLKRISIAAVTPPGNLPVPERPWFLLRAWESADISEAVEQCLQARYGLSQTEAHLARQLTVSGSMNATIDSLGITRNTAKTHLRRIYDKTGAHTQLQLARLVHRLAKLF